MKTISGGGSKPPPYGVAGRLCVSNSELSMPFVLSCKGGTKSPQEDCGILKKYIRYVIIIWKMIQGGVIVRYIIRGLTFLLIPIIVNGVLGYLRQPEQAEDGQVYLPKFVAILGSIISAIFFIPSVITAFSDEPLWVPILFLLLSSLGATFIIAFVNRRISYDQEGFVYKSFFGIKRKFTYEQVTAIKENMYEKFLYVGKRRLMVDELSIGGDDFIKLVKKKYRTMHDGKSLPKIDKTKPDIFNGNVQDVGGFLFTYISVGVMVVGFLIFVVYSAYAPSTPNNTIEESTSFVAFEESEEEIVLTSSDHRIYKICFIDEQFQAKDILTLCDGKTVVTTYSTEVNSKYEDSYYALKAVKCNDDYVLSFDETNRLHRQENTLIVIIAVVMCLVWGGVVMISIIIGRHPQRFSKRVIGLFFKDGYVKY